MLLDIDMITSLKLSRVAVTIPYPVKYLNLLFTPIIVGKRF